MDVIDQEILHLLTQNSRLTNKEIGQKIHLTGQAVGNRILKLQESGIIERFSINIRYSQTQFIRVFLNTTNYTAFEQAVNAFAEVAALYKVSGQACYQITAHFTNEQLSAFIDVISAWARYSVETVISDKTNPRFRT